MTSRFLATALGAALLSALGAQAATAQICWIREVRKSADGVVIVFDGQRSVRLSRPGDEPVTTLLAEDGLLSARRGDSLWSTNAPEDGCTMEVVAVDGQLGVKAKAFFRTPALPDIPPENVVQELFIPAR